jgi:hypothetical protein
MGKIKIIIVGVLFLNISYGENQKGITPPKRWVRRVIHQPDNPPPYTNYSPGEIAIGDARNDGINRLYCANLNNDLVEYTWTGTEWVKTTIFSGTKFEGIVIGKARATDNLNRIYCYRSKGIRKLYEISYENGNWTMQEIPLPMIPSGHLVDAVLIGDGRNDGVNRLYISSSQSKSYEFKYDGNGWVLESIVSNHIAIGALGDGRSDGVNRFYGVTDVDSLFEITYSNGGWEENLIGIWPNSANTSAPHSPLLGPDLFHFGFVGPMVIVNGGYDRIFYAFKYNPTTHIWEVTQMHPYLPAYLYGFGGGFKYCDVMQDPRSYLFKKNLYVPAVPEDVPHGDTLYIHEFSYDASQNTWTRNVISYISVTPGPQLSCIKCGNIRGKDCIYAICEDGTIVEISYE